jgi:hypothetical protein
VVTSACAAQRECKCAEPAVPRAASPQISLKVLSDDGGGAITITETNAARVLHEFDGARLNALQVLAIKDTHPESPPKISPIDEAMAVTDKLLREVTVELDREVVVIAIVGRIGDNWRVLNLF